MSVTYDQRLGDLQASDLEGFFEGWPDPPDPQTHRRLLEGSSHVWFARRGQRVIGFVTAISDGVLSAYIPLLEVLPHERGNGIGAELLRRMLASLDHLYMVDLCCDPDRVAFYERNGMHPAHAMIRRNYAHQSGVE